MQREVVRILKKYLHHAYNEEWGYDNYDNQTEIIYETPYDVLEADGVRNMVNSDFDVVCPPPDHVLLRGLARQLVKQIAGAKYMTLVQIPSEEQAAHFLYTISVLGSERDNKLWAKDNAKYLVRWLSGLTDLETLP